jgi:hypothetical protein
MPIHFHSFSAQFSPSFAFKTNFILKKLFYSRRVFFSFWLAPPTYRHFLSIYLFYTPPLFFS